MTLILNTNQLLRCKDIYIQDLRKCKTKEHVYLIQKSNTIINNNTEVHFEMHNSAG
jgi:hypothetical protein